MSRALSWRCLPSILASLLLAACATKPVPPAAPVLPLPAAPGSAQQPADWRELPGWGADPLHEAWPGLLLSCRSLGRQAAWQALCAEAKGLGDQPAAATVRSFVESRLSPWRVQNADGSREGLVTGYYEPLIQGSRKPSNVFAWPLYGLPDDLVTAAPADAYPDLKPYRQQARRVGDKLVPYYSRAEIDGLKGRFAGKALAYAADPVELFFMQVQGSGYVQLPDGSLMRLAYAGTNGHPYQSIGRWLADKGELRLDQASMEGIKGWARANPGRVQEMFNANPRYVFFREVPSTREGPLGALGVALAEGRSIAVDPRSVPLGAPVFLSTTLPASSQPLQRLVLAQDTGTAIKGGVRADFFWGFGAEAGAMAGKMRQKGEMWVLWPRDQALPAGGGGR